MRNAPLWLEDRVLRVRNSRWRRKRREEGGTDEFANVRALM